MTDNLNQILADCDATQLLSQLQSFDIQVRMHVPEAVLLTDNGELNLRNKYGALLFNCGALTSILRNFLETSS